MSYLKPVLTLVLLECIAQAQSDTLLTTRKSNVSRQPKKDAFNSWIGSIINAFHQAESTERPLDILASNAIWAFQLDKNETSTFGLFEDIISSTEESMIVSAAIWDSGEKPDLPSEGFFDPYEQGQHRNLKPIIHKLFGRRGSQKPALNELSTRRPDTYKMEKETSSANPYNSIASLPWLKTTNIKDKIKDLFNSKNKNGNNTYTIDPDQYKELNGFKPVKPELAVLIHPEDQPEFDLNLVLSKLNRLIASTTSTPGTTEIMSTESKINLSTVPSGHSQTVDFTQKPSIFGPMSTETTEPPIIGPMKPPNDYSNDQDDFRSIKLKEREGYDLITMGKIDKPLNSMLNKFNQTLPTQTDYNKTRELSTINYEHILDNSSELVTIARVQSELKDSAETSTSTTKKRRFPWGVVVSKKPSSTTSTHKMESGLLDKMRGTETPEMITSTTEYTTESIKEHKFEKLSTLRPLLIRPVKPSLLRTKKPKIPIWLSNIFSTISPRSSPKPLITVNPSIFHLLTTKKDHDNSAEGFQLNEHSLLASDEQGNNQTTPAKYTHGYIAGNNSGQGYTGLGHTNGQGGIVIGMNSGIGKRPSRRPFIARPLVSYNTKPPLTQFSEKTEINIQEDNI